MYRHLDGQYHVDNTVIYKLCVLWRLVKMLKIRVSLTQAKLRKSSDQIVSDL
jgi:hypothetical protein